MSASESNNTTIKRVLVVDDEESMCQVLEHLLKREGLFVQTTTSSKEALNIFQSAKGNFDVIIQDIKMPDIDGLTLVSKYKEINPSIMIIIITAFSTFQITVEAMRLGAYDYLRKPFDDNEVVLSTVRRALQAKEFLELKEANHKNPAFRPFIGNNKKMQDIYRLINQVAVTDSPVLIQGENGTGKELVARSLHYNSARLGQAFITVNCGAFPENLLESELFGHVKGAFTTALYDKKGLLEVADKGTFFLDEVSELTPAIQVKLLRVIEEKEFRPVGSNDVKRVDVRFVSATNTNIENNVREGSFREDLFYRLNVIMINLPPLRERKDDIPLLAGHFLAKYNRIFNKNITGFSASALEMLLSYDWPGNVRELENVIHRACILSKEYCIEAANLTPRIKGGWTHKEEPDSFLDDDGIDLAQKMKNMEIEYIQKAINLSGGNTEKAAALLKMPIRSLYYKMKKYGLTD
jgi:DNA-binding NtrC family response regulator